MKQDRRQETKLLEMSFDVLKRDVKRTVRAVAVTSQAGQSTGADRATEGDTLQPQPPQRKPRIMDPTDLEYLKDDVIESLRHEVRHAVKEAVQRQESFAHSLPAINDLYQTHLYTQL